MNFFDSDMLELVEIYQRETLEMMEEYNRHLTHIATQKLIVQENIDAIFRVVHTIKSSSAMIGLDGMSSCTHKLEDLLQIFRKDCKRTIAHEERIIDLLYNYSDYVIDETEKLTDSDFSPSSVDAIDDLIRMELDYFTNTGLQTEFIHGSDAQTSARIAGPSADCDLYSSASDDDVNKTSRVIHVSFSSKCTMENVRAFQLIKKLEPLCSEIESTPSDLQSQNAATQIRKEGLIVKLVTTQDKLIEEALKTSPYVANFSEVELINDAPSNVDESTKGDHEKSKNEHNAPSKSQKFGMVAWDKILAMQNLAGELITSYTLLKDGLEEQHNRKEIEGNLAVMHRLLDKLDRVVAEASMMPVSSIANQYYRMVREISKKVNKKIEFQMEGADIELDRSLLDTISNSLIHLIRNAVDHGIESDDSRTKLGKPEIATVKLIVENLGSNVRFTVTDDGQGINTAKVMKRAKENNLLTKPADEYTEEDIHKFIFAPGFSTKSVANEYSGRGVGMDVVQKTMDSLGGIIHIRSESGRGSSVIMEVPVSMSSTECIGFSVGKYMAMVPIRNIERIASWEECEGSVQKIDGRLWMEQDTLLPIVDLFSLFGEPESEEKCLLIVRGMNKTAALLIGAVKGEQIAVTKPLSPILGSTYMHRYGVSGCSVISSGKLGLVMNIDFLIQILDEGSELHRE